MIHIHLGVLAIVLTGAAMLDGAEPAGPDVRVKAIAVEERRFKSLDDAAKDDVVPLQPYQLTLSVELKGAVIADAVNYGMIRFKASDDQGKEVKQRFLPIVGEDKAFHPISRGEMWMGLDDPPADRIRLDLEMDAPARGAAKLTTVEGSVKLHIGKGQDIFIANPARLVNKEITDPLLKAGGVKVTLETYDPKASDGITYAKIKVEGKVGVLSRIDVVDESGKSLADSYSVGGTGTSYTHEALGVEPLPANTRLKLTVVTELKEIEVPIKLKDVALP